ncbi:hypoxia induced protein conserved region-domain-containing protein [Calycina marina]|uniref:Hypoxia induced protein conserved region-domain-containing protein n=1 Tax=Calycina marina TaxID=1763456 RepID=A0A9P8CCP0_9HELO|nr:hypoxia induced protein conserved region-domain-containing protein [Calycina marina]
MSRAPMPSSFDGNAEFYEESGFQKITRRLKEEPLIPLGCILTAAALIGASKSIRAGDHNRAQRMFRARIVAQGFTLVAMLAGSAYWQSDREKRKEFDNLMDEKKARQKQAAWIRELEARDEEDKAMREAMKRRRESGGKGVVGELKDGDTRAQVQKAVDEARENAEKAKAVAAEKAWAVKEDLASAGDSKTSNAGTESGHPEEAKEKGVLESVQSLLWKKK